MQQWRFYNVSATEMPTNCTMFGHEEVCWSWFMQLNVTTEPLEQSGGKQSVGFVRRQETSGGERMLNKQVWRCSKISKKGLLINIQIHTHTKAVFIYWGASFTTGKSLLSCCLSLRPWKSAGTQREKVGTNPNNRALCPTCSPWWL